jgi:hypothetical protein
MNWKKQTISLLLWEGVNSLYKRYRSCDARHPFWVFYQHWKIHREAVVDEFISKRPTNYTLAK